MNKSRPSDPAERSALMRLFYRNWGTRRASAVGSIDGRAGGPASGCRLDSRPSSRSVVAHPAADARPPW
jgi:hypothetical protein